MIRAIVITCALAMAGLPAAVGQAVPASSDADGLVRLPGQGELKAPERRTGARERLAPGGGVLLSFDENADGLVSDAEFDAGLSRAFDIADVNEDGTLTVFEQQDWARGLPTRDDSLTNPVRFDPNLDRQVSYDEFTLVIRSLAQPYRDELSGDVVLARLKQPDPRRNAREEQIQLPQGVRRPPARP